MQMLESDHWKMMAAASGVEDLAKKAIFALPGQRAALSFFQ
jgi:hypothetical protein